MTTNVPNESQKRPWPVGVKVLITLSCVALTVLGIVQFLGVAATARWDRYAARLREDGTPLTYEEIIARRTEIPDGPNGAQVIERLHDRLEALTKASIDHRVFTFGRGRSDVDFFTGIPRDGLELSREFIEPHRGLLAELSVLQDIPTGLFRVDYDPATQSPSDIVFPKMRALRNAGKLAYVAEVSELIEGNLTGAVNSVRIQFAVAATLDEHPSLIGRLIQMAGDALACRGIENTLRVGELDDHALGELLKTVRERRQAATMRWAFASERAFFLEVCEGLISGKLTPDSRMSIYASSLPPYLPDVLVRNNQMRGVEMLTWLVDAKDDPALLIEAAKRIDREGPALSATEILVRMFLPSLSRAVTLHLRSTAELDCAIAALAAERYRLANGRLPASIDVLVPVYLDAVPLDPFDGNPMRFAVTDEGIVIYSIYEDLTDDGGIVARQKIRPHNLDVGFRLNRPEHRGPPLILEPPPNEDD